MELYLGRYVHVLWNDTTVRIEHHEDLYFLSKMLYTLLLLIRDCLFCFDTRIRLFLKLANEDTRVESGLWDGFGDFDGRLYEF